MMEEFDNWNKIKKEIESKEYNNDNIEVYYKEREIWYISIGKNIGTEEVGKGEHFERPVLILRKFNEKMFFGIPLTTKVKDSKFLASYILCDKQYAAKISQLKLIDSKRLLRKISILDVEQFENIKSKFLNLFIK